MKNIYLSIFLLFVLSSCEEIDDPFPEVQEASFSLDGETEFVIPEGIGIEDTNDIKSFINDNAWRETQSANNSNRRFIVLEEYTGHKCINCVPASKELFRLDSIFGAQLVPVAIHAGNFARPEPSPSLYTLDLREVNGLGDEYANLFGIPSYPQGIVSRLNGAEVVNKDTWQTKINSIKDDIPKVSLNLTNFYSESLNILRTQIDIEWKETLSENYNLQLYIKEDSILGAQKNGFADLLNYNHRHVLRKVVNGKFGKSLGSATMGNTVKLQYFIPFEDGWKDQHLEIIAFIFDTDPSSYEIIQANSAFFVPR